jgi:hypothetical protein
VSFPLSERKFDQPLPADVARVCDLMSTFPGDWALCGGWTVDAWLGRFTREHHDVDIVVFLDDERALKEHMSDYTMVLHDMKWDAKVPIWPNQPIPEAELWTGRPIHAPGHFHVRSADDFDFEINVNEREDGRFIAHPETRISYPMDEAIGVSSFGVPTLAPVLVAFLKMVGVEQQKDWKMRPHDEADVELLLTLLAPAQLTWLRESVASVAPGHGWLPRLGGAPS